METTIKLKEAKPLVVISDTKFDDGHRVVVHTEGVVITKGIDTIFILLKGKKII